MKQTPIGYSRVVFTLNSINSCCCLLLGNKCDLEEERQVQFEEACNFANNEGMLAALETSAKVITYKTRTTGFEVDQICNPKFSFSLSRRVRTWRKPSWWWPESYWLATALGSNSRGTWKATADLNCSSGPTLGQWTTLQVPTRHQRRRHVAESDVDRTGQLNGGRCWKVDSGWRTFHCNSWRRSEDPQVCGTGLSLGTSQRLWIFALLKKNILRNQFCVLFCD